MTKNNFIQGTVILFISGIFIKIIGFLYQIIIIRMVGTEAIGVFNMAFPIYITALVLSTAGIPLAISKLVSNQLVFNNIHNIYKTLKISLAFLFFFSIIITSFLVFISPYIFSVFFNDSRVSLCFLGMLPCILIVSISSAFRGFFQGLQEMAYPAITQCIEQVCRISVGVIFIVKLKPYGIKAIAFGLSSAMIVGEIIGFIFIILFFIIKTKKIKKNHLQKPNNKTFSSNSIICKIFSFGLPTTLTRLTASIVLSFEASLIPLCLQKCGFNVSQATDIYGQFSGVALTILTIPTVLTFSLATSLVPAISEAEAQGQSFLLKNRTTEALRLTYLFGIPISAILFLKASSISALLFNMPYIGTTIRYLSLGALFLYLAQTSNGILQGLGMVNKILFNTIIGAVIKIAGIFYLTTKPELNINGAAIAFILSYFVICILNLKIVKKTCNFSLNFFQILLPFVGTILMSFLLIFQTNFLSKLFSANFTTVISVATAGAFYVFLLCFFKQLDLKSITKNIF